MKRTLKLKKVGMKKQKTWVGHIFRSQHYIIRSLYKISRKMNIRF